MYRLFILTFVYLLTVGAEVVKNDEVLQLKDEVQQIKTLLGDQQTVIQNQGQLIHELKQKLTDVENAARNSSEVIAFTAYATVERFYTEGDVVLFDGVLSNFGNAYNATESFFQCPVNGIYVFSVHIYSGSDANMIVEIHLDDVALMSVRADDIHPNQMHATGQVVVECTEGQLVWIRASAINDMYLYSSYGQSHFTGFLMRAA